MIINADKKFVFFHIPKNAGKYVRAHILRNKGRDHIISLWGVSKPENIDKAHVNQSTYGSFIDLDISHYYKFCVIRDPYDRLFSAYKHALKHDRVTNSAYLGHKGINSFEDMLKYLGKNPDEIYNPKLIWFIPQYVFIYKKEKENMDLMINFHDMSKGLRLLKDRFGFSKEAKVDESLLGKNPLLSQQHKEITEALYAQDFQWLPFEKRACCSA